MDPVKTQNVAFVEGHANETVSRGLSSRSSGYIAPQRVPSLTLVTAMARLAEVVEVEGLRRSLVAWLDYEDKVWLWLCALEWGFDDFARFVRYEATTATFPDDDALVQMAVSYGCFNAARQVIEKTRNLDSRPASSVDWIRWFDAHHPRVYSSDVMERAATQGDLALVQWLHTTCSYDTQPTVVAAARRGHLEFAQWLLDHHSASVAVRDKMSYDEFVVDVRLGELGLLGWTLKAHFPERWFCLRDSKAPNGVIIDGSTDGDKLRVSRGVSTMDALAFAVSVGDLGLLQCIHQDKDLCPDPSKSDAVSLAARLARLEMMKWLVEQGIDSISDRVIYEAARSGRLEALQWVRSCERLQSFEPGVLLSAGVASGSQEVVEWICHTFPTASLTLDRRSGVYLRDIELVEVVSVLEWLCVNGRAQPEEWMIQVACRTGSVSLLRLLMEHISQNELDFSSLGNWWREACARDHLEVVRYLYEEFDLYWDYAFEYAAGNGHKKVAEYMFGVNPVKCRAISKETAVRMIYDGHADVLEWVYSVHKVDLETVWHDAVVYYFETVSLRDALAFPLTRTPKTDTGLRAVAQWALDRDEFWVHDLQIVAKWAAQRCQVDILRSVVATIIKHLEHHPLTRHAQLSKVLDAVVENTTLGDVVQTILQQDPSLLDDSVVQWATRYHQRGILDLAAQAQG